jgi:hypothetical protein
MDLESEPSAHHDCNHDELGDIFSTLQHIGDTFRDNDGYSLLGDLLLRPKCSTGIIKQAKSALKMARNNRG